MAKIKGNNQANTLSGTSGKDKIKGKDGDDIIFGLGGNDDLDGGKGNDTITGGSGNDSIDGGKGTDTAVYSGLYSQYVITRKRSDDDDHGHCDDDDDNGHGRLTVRDTVADRDGTDSLKKVEALQFADGTYNVKTGVFTDTLAPAVAVDIADPSLSDADNSSQVTFSFSEATADFDNSDVTVTGGTLSAITGSGTSYTATFTADDGFDGTGSVTVNAGSYTDAAGNAGAGDDDTVAIDTKNPTVAVDIVDGSLSDADNSSQVTFSFSEATADFDNSDVTVVGGTLGAISGSGTSYTATFTAADDFDGTGSVTVNAGSYHDAAGNAGAEGSDNVAIDTVDVGPVGALKWVAYIDRDLDHNYSAGIDGLIAGVFDTDGNGVDPGDTLFFDVYPLDFTHDGPTGTFQNKQHEISYVGPNTDPSGTTIGIHVGVTGPTGTDTDFFFRKGGGGHDYFAGNLSPTPTATFVPGFYFLDYHAGSGNPSFRDTITVVADPVSDPDTPVPLTETPLFNVNFDGHFFDVDFLV